MHAAHAGKHRLSRAGSVGQTCGVIGSVQCRTDIVGHAAIHRHIHTLVNRVAGTVFGIAQVHMLDGAYTIQGHAGWSHDVTAGLEADGRSGHAQSTIGVADRDGQTSELHIDVHGIFVVGVGHGVTTAEIDFGQDVGVGGPQGLAQQHHALGGVDEGIRVVDVGADMRVSTDQFQHILIGQDGLEHGNGRTVCDGFHRGGKYLIRIGDFLMAQVVRILDVITQFACRFAAPAGGNYRRSRLRVVIASINVRLRNTRVGRGRCHVRQVVQHVEHCGVGSGRQQRDAELLILVSGGDVFVTTGMHADSDTQHHAGALAEFTGDGSDALRLIRLIDHDFGEALFDGQRDFIIGLVVAMQH